jgi:hypothetical protein
MCSSNAAHAAVLLRFHAVRVLMEEYGTGRYSRKHSTFYKAMMEELGLNTSEWLHTAGDWVMQLLQ